MPSFGKVRYIPCRSTVPRKAVLDCRFPGLREHESGNQDSAALCGEDLKSLADELERREERGALHVMPMAPRDLAAVFSWNAGRRRE